MKRFLMMALLLVAAASAGAETLTVARYVAALTQLRTLIAAKQLDAAKSAAAELAKDDYVCTGGPCLTDRVLLGAVTAAKTNDVTLIARLDATIAALRTVSPTPSATPDPKLLEQLAREEAVGELPKGGNVAVVEPNATIVERISKLFEKAVEWTAERIQELMDWLEKFWPKNAKSKASANMRWIIGGVVALIVITLAVLAYEVLRRSRAARREAVAESVPLGSTRDADPLSRGANEWERYAAQLAAAGRFREAIRAWYHAVLVTLYGAAILHFRKGRTNWEYVAALAPSLNWRARFIELTRRFEAEWYGADESTADALETCSSAAREIIDAVRRTKEAA